MATSTPMSLPLTLLFLSLILLLAPATKADIALFSSDHSERNSLLTSQTRRTIINGGETLPGARLTMVVKEDCSIYLYVARSLKLAFVLETGLPTRDCYLYVSNRGVLYVYPRDIRIAPRPLWGKESEEGRYALVFHNATLGIYGPAIWSNGVGWKEEEELQSAISGSRTNIFYSGAVFEGSQNGAVLVARQGNSELDLQSVVAAYLRPSCTLAVQEKNDTVLWSTWTDHTVQGQCKLELLSDGQLVIRDYFSSLKEGKTVTDYVEVFNSGYKSKDDGSYICLLWVEGEMMIYGRKDWIYAGLSQRIEMVTQ